MVRRCARGADGGSLARRKTTAAAGATAATHYDAADIAVLEGVEHVRLRPGMYIGTTGQRGLHHLVYEVVDNSVDEAMAGSCDRILVTLTRDGSCRVADNGRGIPVKPIPGAKDRRPALEVVLTTLNAGGKFGGAGYRISGGLHGVGVSVVNALSAKMIAEVVRDGHLWTQTYSRGKATTKLVKGRPSKKTGTTITFWPDPEVLEDTVFKPEILAERLQELAYLTKGLEIVLSTSASPNRSGRCSRLPAGWRTSCGTSRRRRLFITASSTSRARRATGRPRSRSPCSGTPGTRSRCTRSRTRSTPTRAACTRKGSRRL